MGALRDSADSPDIRAAQDDLDAMNSELGLDLAQSALDIAGIADPTPISDGLSGILSLARGDFVGAGLSLISMVPYAGDALGKTAKGAKLAAKIAALKKKIEAQVALINKLRQKSAAAAVRAKRKAAAAKKAAGESCTQACPPVSKGAKRTQNKPRTPGEKRGTFTGDRETGNGTWQPDSKQDPDLYDALPSDRKYIKYEDGHPDFSPFETKRVEIQQTGIDNDDFAAANQAAGFGSRASDTPKGYTWHHNEDGVTMQLVPEDIHGNTPHTGGAAYVSDSEF